MSFVEKALKKIQQSRQSIEPAPVPLTGSLGSLVPARDAAPRQSVQAKRPSVRTDMIVHVDRGALRAAGLLPPESQERQLADQYRALKRPIIRAAFEENRDEGDRLPRSAVMFTSGLPGDGKTFTCINLCLSMSREQDHSVILVDADVAKPHVSTLFGVEREPGLLDVLSDPNKSIESVVLPTDIPGLSIVPAGTRSETATELLASERMQLVIAQLAALDPKGIVALDSPPVLLTSEARALAGWVGQVVVIVKAGITPRTAVTETVELLRSHPRVSLILNQVDVIDQSGYYGYGYAAERSGAQSQRSAKQGVNDTEE